MQPRLMFGLHQISDQTLNGWTDDIVSLGTGINWIELA
jgi:hypothetical protein